MTPVQFSTLSWRPQGCSGAVSVTVRKGGGAGHGDLRVGGVFKDVCILAPRLGEMMYIIELYWTNLVKL